MKRISGYSLAAIVALLCLISFCGFVLLTGGVGPTAMAQSGCVASGNQNAIKARLDQTGHANLCPNAVFNLTGTVFLSQNQEIYTEGNPTDDSRALLRIAADTYIDPVSGSQPLSMAIQAKNQSNIDIHHIRVFGNLPEFGRLFPGDALIELGGAAIDQKVQFVKSYEPRGWTALHIFEAPSGLECRNAQILDNEIGPAGHSNGNYADGISLACPNSIVMRNTIVDATDGGIVIFGAPGSIVSNNTIRARHRTLTGGINLIDPWDYSGTVVRDNAIIAEGAQIKVGIQVGNILLSCGGQSVPGGRIEGNVLQGPYMGYGIAVSGASNFTIPGNISSATHSGMPTIGCQSGQEVNDPPAFQADAPKAFQRNTATTSGTFQADFQSAQLNARPINLEPDPSSPNWARVPGENIWTSGPAAATAPDGSVYLISRGTESGGHFVYYTHPNFQDYSSKWQSASPEMATADRPAPVFDSSGRLRIYIEGNDHKIYRNILQGTTWLGWNEVSGNRTTPSAPAAVLFNGQINILVRGNDNLIYHKVDEEGADPNWYAMSGNQATLSEPSLATQGNKLYVVVRADPDQSLRLNTFTSSWDNSSGWISLGGYTGSAPAAVSGPDGHLRVYARGADSRLYLGTLLGTTWSGFSESFPSIETKWPPAAAMHQGSVRLFVTGEPTPGAGAFWSRNTDADTRRMNVALAANGALSTASSAYSGWAASGANNGDRKGLNSGYDGGWITAQSGFPAWLQVDFNGSKIIDEIDVFTLQNNWQAPSEPTETMTFSQYGLTGYDVQYWEGASWVTVSGGSVTGNDKVWRKLTFAAIATTKIRVLTNASTDGYSRLTEVEAWQPRTNVALAATGAVATGSSAYAGWAASGANNGDRKGLNSGYDGGWITAQTGFPAWLQVDFNGSKVIDEIDVFTLQNNWQNPSEPTEAMTFSQLGLTGYDVQYWDGASWVTVSGGSVTGNDKVWRKFTFAAIATTKIRVLTNASIDGYSRLTEVEAWTGALPPPDNFALAANGAVATASSAYSGWAASGAINGDRKGLNGGYDGDWVTAQSGFPAWLQVDFNGSKIIGEIDVVSVQNDWQNPSEPTEAMTFSQHGLVGYDVQYWDGASWVTVSGGSVTGNNKVWRKFTFAPIATTKIRVLANASIDGYSRLAELEAWGPPP